MARQARSHKVTEQYIDTETPIIEKQLLYAGLRLAAVLERYFSNAQGKEKNSP
jgi:hypothetical protein